MITDNDVRRWFTNYAPYEHVSIPWREMPLSQTSNSSNVATNSTSDASNHDHLDGFRYSITTTLRWPDPPRWEWHELKEDFVYETKEKPMTPQEKNQKFFNEIDWFLELWEQKNDLAEFRERNVSSFCYIKDMIISLARDIDYSFNEEIKVHSEIDANENGILTEKIIFKRMEHLSDWACNRLRNSIVEIESRIQRRREVLEKLEKRSDTDIVQEIITLNNLFPYDAKTGYWQLPDFELTDEDDNSYTFKGFLAEIDPEQSYSTDAVIIHPPREAEYKNDVPHPHVNENGNVCFGEAEYPAMIFWKNGNYVAYMQLVCSILSTYNSKSPYEPLRSWVYGESVNCECCGETLYPREDEINYHEISGSPGCEECTRWVEGKNGYYWSDETIWSYLYDEYILKENAIEIVTSYGAYGPDYDWVNKDDDTIRTCDHCGNYIHEDVLSCETFSERYGYKNVCTRCEEIAFTECSDCGDMVLSEDAVSSDDLNDHDLYCDNCVFACKECGDTVARHLNESDEICDHCREELEKETELEKENAA